MPLLTQIWGHWSIAVVRDHMDVVWKEIWAGWDRFSTFVSFKVGMVRESGFGMIFGVEINH